MDTGDLCPQSLAGARARYEGCSMLDLVVSPGAAIHDAIAETRDAGRSLTRQRGMFARTRAPSASLARGLQRFQTAAARLAFEPCIVSRDAGAGLRDMRATSQRATVLGGLLAIVLLLPAQADAAIQSSFACSPACAVTPGTTVTFTSTSTSDTAIREYAWDLDGDGRYGRDDEPDEPQGTGQTQAPRAFNDAGDYTIGLRVTNASESSTATKEVTVRAAEPPPAAQPPTPGSPKPLAPLAPGDPLSPPPGSDLDGDGVAARSDACPRTPRRTKTLWAGCAALDLLRDARRLTGPALAGLTDARGLLGKGLGRPRNRSSRAGALLVRAVSALEIGQPCVAAQTYRRAVGQLKRARLDLDAIFRRRSAQAAGRFAGDDVSDRQLAVAALDLKRSLASAALTRVRTAGPVFTAPCGSVTRAFNLRGKVALTDDAGRVLQLAGGQRVLLARQARVRGVTGDAAVVRVGGLRFKDGTSVATTVIAGAQKEPAIGKPPGNPLPTKCLALRVAPIQSFLPHVQPAQITLHDPAGYRGAFAVHVLERDMRLGVKKRVGCSDTLGGKNLRYFAVIRERNGLLTDVLGPALRDGELPVEFGAITKDGGTASIALTTYRQACVKQLCDPPVELDTQKLAFQLRARASLAIVTYSDTSFGTKDNDLTGDHESTQVVDLKLKSLAVTASGFEASAFVLENGAETRPQTRLVGLDQSFLIYAADDSDDSLFPLLTHGTDTRSGLAWPRVAGVRNGSAFWYSAALPPIVRDRTLNGTCIASPASTLPAGPPNPNSSDPDVPNFPPANPFPVPAVADSYYELPFAFGFGPIGSGGLNIDDPQFSGRHGDTQPWALDLTAPHGTPLLAARSGVVVNLFDDDKYNDAPTYDDPENDDNRPKTNDKIGNFIWVRHEDASYAVYFHHRRHTAKVKLGDTVRRGQTLAEIGSTGLATGPHVHFGPFSYTGLINVGETNPGGTVGTNLRARYGAAVVPDSLSIALFGVADPAPCYIPRKGDRYFSTNASPMGD